MKKNNFQELYQEIENDRNSGEIQEIWNEANKERRNFNKIALIICLILDILIISFITFRTEVLSFINESKGIGIFISIIWYIIPIIVLDIITCAILSIPYGKKGREYKKIFKEKIIKDLINNFYDDLKYFPEKQMPREIYNEAKYHEYYNRYYSDDYIEAKINNEYFINMAEVKTQRKETKTDSDGNTSTRIYTIFHGLFSKIIINKSIKSELIITPNGKVPLNKNKLEMDSRRI